MALDVTSGILIDMKSKGIAATRTKMAGLNKSVLTANSTV